MAKKAVVRLLFSLKFIFLYILNKRLHTLMMHEGRIVVDVKGEEKKKLTIEQLLQMFEQSSGTQMTSDKVMLSR